VHRLSVLVFVLLLAAPGSAGADGCAPTQCGIYSNATPGSRFLIWRTNGDRGPLRVLDVVKRRQSAALPPGILSADGRRFVVVQTFHGTETYVWTYGVPGGTQLTRRKLTGRHVLVGVSRDARRVVLVRAGGPPRTTTFEIFDRGRLSKVLRLKGSYDLETLSTDATRLFLVHWRENGYDLRLANVATGRVRPTPTFEDGSREKMVGNAWRAIATRDGRWLLTLYLEGDGGFIHALDLQRGVGHCVDLPVKTRDLSLGASALALSPDERTLYVAAPVLGRVIAIDLRRPHVTRVSRFEPWLGHDEVGFTSAPNAAVSPGGRTLYFSGNSLLWAYDRASGRVRGPYPATRIVSALAFTPDGRRVIAFGGDGRSRALDAATGRRLG